MADLARVTFLLDGWPGAPGVNVLHFSPGNADWDDQGDIDEFYDTLNTLTGTLGNTFVPGVSIQANPELQVFDSETGNITAVKSPTDVPTITTSTAAASATSRATMALIQFRTGAYVDGRQVKGRMFLGPLSAGELATTGLIATARQADYPDWFEAITTGLGPRLCVWRRPTPAAPSSGLYEDVIQVSVRPTPSYLSSRLF